MHVEVTSNTRYRVKDCFNEETLMLIIESLVLSKLFYSSTVRANTSDSNIKKLQLVQNCAARITTGAQKYDHISLSTRPRTASCKRPFTL